MLSFACFLDGEDETPIFAFYVYAISAVLSW